MVDIILTEWQSAIVTLSAPDVRYIAELANRYDSALLTLTPQGGDVYLARASHFVGILRLPDGRTLEIRPKVPVGNVFAMLNKVNALGAFLPTLANVDTFAGLLDILLDQFARELELILRHGLLRGFATQQDVSVMIRGKLDLSETLRQAPTLRHHSESSDATSDILENQVLCLACQFIRTHLPLSVEHERRFEAFLQKLSHLSTANICRDAVKRVQFTRLNEYYRPALALVELLLADQAPTTDGTRTQHPSFLVDMNTLFERYTTILLQEYIDGRIVVNVQASYPLDHTGLLTVRPDMVLSAKQGAVVPVDAKYKLYSHNEDIYQMLAYCHALHTTRAVLIYPFAARPQRVEIESKGGVNFVIVVLALDLTGDVTIMRNNAMQLATAVQHIVDEVS